MQLFCIAMEKCPRNKIKHKKTKAITTTPVTSTVDVNPFSKFPEEHWLMILKRIQNHVTLQNVFNAVQDFYTVFGEQFPNIKFIQVSPLTFEHPQLNIQTSCLLDKDWCDSVSIFLQHHPPINSSHFSVGKSVKKEIVPRMSFNYLLPQKKLDLEASQVCSTVEEIHQFHTKLKESCANSVLHIKLCKETFTEPKIYFDACIDLFRAYGYLFRSVSLVLQSHFIADREKMKEFFQGIANCLQHLTKIQALSINVIMENCHFVDIGTVIFPLLSSLEDLEIGCPAFPTSQDACVQNYLLDCFRKSGYFKILQIKTLTLLKVLRNEIFQERFRFFLKYKLEQVDNTRDINEFLKFLESQKKESIVAKLNPSSLCHLLGWINLTKLETEELHIDVSLYGGFRSIDAHIVSLPSIRYLKLTGNQLTGFQFLTAFPSLQYLHVQYRLSCANRRAPSESPLSKLQFQYLYRKRIPNECNIWNELPTLRLLIVEHLGSSEKPSFKHFVREYGNKPVIFTQDFSNPIVG